MRFIYIVISSFLAINYKSAALSKPSMTRSSLYASVKNAPLGRILKSLLTSLIKDCVPSIGSCRLLHSAEPKTYDCETVQR